MSLKDLIIAWQTSADALLSLAGDNNASVLGFNNDLHDALTTGPDTAALAVGRAALAYERAKRTPEVQSARAAYLEALAAALGEEVTG